MKFSAMYLTNEYTNIMPLCELWILFIACSTKMHAIFNKIFENDKFSLKLDDTNQIQNWLVYCWSIHLAKWLRMMNFLSCLCSTKLYLRKNIPRPSLCFCFYTLTVLLFAISTHDIVQRARLVFFSSTEQIQFGGIFKRRQKTLTHIKCQLTSNCSSNVLQTISEKQARRLNCLDKFAWNRRNYEFMQALQVVHIVSLDANYRFFTCSSMLFLSFSVFFLVFHSISHPFSFFSLHLLLSFVVFPPEIISA